MEGLRKSLSRLSLAEPNMNLSAQQLMGVASVKSGWLRYRKKCIVVLSNVKLIRRLLNRFITWPNRFIVLTMDAVHIFKSEFQNRTERSLNMVDIERVVMCSDQGNYEWCIKMVPKDTEQLPVLLAAPLKNVQRQWYKSIEEHLRRFQNSCWESEDAQAEYTEAYQGGENWYNEIELSDEEFTRNVVTYNGTRDEIADLMRLCATKGKYVIRKSRRGESAVLTVFDGTCLKEYMILREVHYFIDDYQ